MALTTGNGVAVNLSPGVLREAHAHRGAAPWRIARLTEQLLIAAPAGGEVWLPSWGRFFVQRTGMAVAIRMADEERP